MERQRDLQSMLERARACISQGNPTQALDLVVNVVRRTRGEAAIMQVLSEAKETAQREGYLTKEEFDELKNSLEGETDPEAIPIISESGKEQILRDAYADGSSFICKRCGALVSRKRKTSHEQLWCDAL
jgi:hypothetical protein